MREVLRGRALDRALLGTVIEEKLLMDKSEDGVALVGRPAPAFRLLCTDIKQPKPHEVQLSDFRGRWLALLFYPPDFSFVCPTELTSFSARAADWTSVSE